MKHDALDIETDMGWTDDYARGWNDRGEVLARGAEPVIFTTDWDGVAWKGLALLVSIATILGMIFAGRLAWQFAEGLCR